MPPCCRRASKAGTIPATTKPTSRARSATRTTRSRSMPSPSATTTRCIPNTVLLRAPTANNGDSRDGGNVGGWLTIFKGAPNVDLAKQLALDLLDPANFGKIAALGGVLFTPAYAEPLDRRTARERSEPCDHQGAGQRRPTRSSASPGRPTPTPASTPSAPRACSSSGRQRHLRAHDARRCGQGRAPEDGRPLRRRRHHAAVRRHPCVRRAALPPSRRPRCRSVMAGPAATPIARQLTATSRPSRPCLQP